MKRSLVLMMVAGLVQFFCSSGYAATLDDNFSDDVVDTENQWMCPSGTDDMSEYDGAFYLDYESANAEVYTYSNCYNDYGWKTADHGILKLWTLDVPTWLGLYQSWTGPEERSDFLIYPQVGKVSFYARGVASGSWVISTVNFPGSWDGSSENTYWEIEFGQTATGTQKKVSFRGWKPLDYSETWQPNGQAPDISWDAFYEPGASEVMVKISQCSYGDGLSGAVDRVVCGLFETPRVPGDANGDSKVDVSDLGILAANYGTTSGATLDKGDFNGDGAVDVSDLGILAANYGTGTTVAADFNADYAKIFGAAAEEDEAEDTTSSACSSLGLSLIAGLAMLGLMLVKLED